MTHACPQSTDNTTLRRLRSAFATAVVAIAALPAAAQGQLWIRQLGTSEADLANAVAPGPGGAVYSSGSTQGSLGGPNAGDHDAWLALHDGAGNQVWIRQLGADDWDEASAAALDGAGGVYAAGSTQGGSLGGLNAGGWDAWLARFDGGGNQLWIRQLGSSGDDFTYAAAADGSGGVFVSGFTDGGLGGLGAGAEDAWLARYDATGSLQWVRQLGTGAADNSFAAVSDGSDGVFVSGWTGGSLGGPSAGGDDIWLAHYDSAGNQLWIRQLGTGSLDLASSGASDGSGGVYLSGYTQGSLAGPTAGGNDAWLARFDGAGNLLWMRQTGTGASDIARATAADGSGGAYVGGRTTGNLGGPAAGSSDAWLARYDAAGNALWVVQSGSAAFDSVTAAAADGSGGVFLGGTTQGTLGGASAGLSDAWLARYDGECGASSSFCSASSSSIPGCHAALSAVGSPRLSDPDGFSISSGSVPGGNLGICFFGGNGPASIAFGTLGGQLCVQPPFYRTSAKSGGGSPGVCNGAFAFTLQDLIDSSPILVEGASIQAEIWARDPANPDGFLLSDALQFTVCH